MDFAKGRIEIWALRAGSDLVAVLQTRLTPAPVAVELLAPRNDTGVGGHGHDLARWLIAAGIRVDPQCRSRVVDLLPRHFWAESDLDRMLPAA